MALTADAQNRLNIALASQAAGVEVATILNNAATNSNIALSGNLTVTGNAAITGNETLTGNLAVTGTSAFASTLTLASNSNIALNATGGTRLGTNATQKLGLWGVAPVVQPAGTGELLGLNGNSATAANATNMNSNGNTGSAAYTFNDVVKALKQAGMLTS